MSIEFIQDTHSKGFLKEIDVKGKKLLVLNTPCSFKIRDKIIQQLKDSYLPNEELGGILWAKPTIEDGTAVFIVDKVSFIRNAIEDKERTDNRKKSNAYLPDNLEYQSTFKSVIDSYCFPIKFHTHPTKNDNHLSEVLSHIYQTDTSEQDRRESENHHLIANTNLLLPRALVVGSTLSPDIFIGLYDGFITPKGFEDSKAILQRQNFDKLSKHLANVTFTDNQKIVLALILGGLLFLTIKYPRFSIPVIISIFIAAQLLSQNTDSVEAPYYFNRLRRGEGKIFIPDEVTVKEMFSTWHA